MGKEKEVWKKEVRGHPWDNQKSCHVKNSREPIKGLVFKSWLNLKNRDKNLKIEFNLNLLCSKRGSEVKASACNAGDLGSIPGPGRSPGEGNSNPLQCSCLENPMDRGASWAIVHGVAKSQTWLSDFTSLHKRHRATQMKTVGSESVTYFLYW